MLSFLMAFHHSFCHHSLSSSRQLVNWELEGPFKVFFPPGLILERRLPGPEMLSKLPKVTQQVTVFWDPTQETTHSFLPWKTISRLNSCTRPPGLCFQRRNEVGSIFNRWPALLRPRSLTIAVQERPASQRHSQLMENNKRPK